MFLHKWLTILALVLSVLSSISRQTDLDTSETYVVPQWIAPQPQQSQLFQDTMRPVRHAKIGDTKLKISLASHLSANNTMGNRDNTSNNMEFLSPPSESTKYRGAFNGIEISQNGQTQFLNVHRPYSSDYRNMYTNPIYSGVGKCGLPNSYCNADILILANFDKNDCNGQDRGDYSVQLMINRGKICTDVSPIQCTGINTLISNIDRSTTAERFIILYGFSADFGEYKLIFLVGYFVQGRYEGKYFALAVNLLRTKIQAKCVGVMGSGEIRADATSLWIANREPKEMIECYDNPMICLSESTWKPQISCKGKAIVA